MRGDLLVLAPAGLGRLDGLYEGLAERGWNVTRAEVAEPPLRQWIARAWSLRPRAANRHRAFERVYGRLARTEAAFKERSLAAGRALAGAGGPFDCILQVGGMFAPSWPPPPTPYALFCDCTVKLGDGVPSSGVHFPRPAVAEGWYRLEGELYRRASCVFTASRWARRSLVVDYGVSPARALAVGEGSNLAAPLGLDRGHDGRTILFVGYEFERKGGPVLLEAFRQVSALLPGVELVLVGPKRLPHPLPAGARLLGSLPRERLAALYSRASLFVLPSLFEPFGLVLLEAMEHGLPCVGSDRCAIPEIIADGETGLIAPAGDPEVLATRILRLLSHRELARQMGARGRSRVRERFTWPLVAERVDDALGRLLPHRPGSAPRWPAPAATPGPAARVEAAFHQTEAIPVPTPARRDAGDGFRRAPAVLRSGMRVADDGSRGPVDIDPRGAPSDMRTGIQVLQFVSSLSLGGTERQFVHLVEGLRGSEFRVHVACFRAEGELKEPLCRDHLPLTEYPLRSLKSPSSLAPLLSLVRYLRRNRIEVVHTTNVYPNVFGVVAARLARTPVVVASVRDMGLMWSPVLSRLQRAACRLADAVVANAEAVAGRLRAEGYDPERIEVIRNGIVSACFAPRSHPAFRRALGLPAAAPLVAVICRLHRVKRLEDFVDAAALLSRLHREARFLIVGPYAGSATGEAYAEELRARADRLGLGDRVVFTGGRTDVPRLLTELAVSVLPSETEGLSNTLLESMAAGVPVVATAVGGNPEVVQHGVNGLLVPAGDPRALAEAIGRLLDSESLARRLGRAGRASVEERFARDRMVAQTMALYRRLLARARSTRTVQRVPAAAANLAAGPDGSAGASELGHVG